MYLVSIGGRVHTCRPWSAFLELAARVEGKGGLGSWVGLVGLELEGLEGGLDLGLGGHAQVYLGAGAPGIPGLGPCRMKTVPWQICHVV